MSHVSFSQLISVNYPKIFPKTTAQPTLAEVLQSDPVKRLLSQPNIVIETIPNPVANESLSSPNNVKVPANKRNGSGKEAQGKTIRPEISIVPVDVTKDESRLLPSKANGNSEIALLVVKPDQKHCGHNEPCEDIVCDVSVQQYVDQSGVLPMLAVGIQADEINAPVAKHCKNPRCDALSIEHDRCRRALIKLYRCDETSACDICGIFFQTRRSRISHRICIRKDVYRHNQTDGAQVLREKMRERELQMIHMTKMKRQKKFLDPVTEYKKTMESLRNNKELIVIPKTIPQPVVTITNVPQKEGENRPQQSISKEAFGKLLPSIPIVFPSQNVAVGKRQGPEPSETPPAKHPKIANVFCSALPVGSLPVIHTPGQQLIKVTSVTQPNFVQPVSFNNWFMSQANIVGSNHSRPLKPYLTPIRVVPITSLKSAPSLRHQTHGIPAFCLVPDTSKPPVPGRLQSIQPAPAPPSLVSVEPKVQDDQEKSTNATPKLQKKPQGRRKSEDKSLKVYKCPYCLKGFSTDWYFKMHVAGHKGEMLFSCKTCEKPFSNRYDMKKHMLNDHNEGECKCEICGQISICNSALEIHIRSHTGERPFHCEECNSSYRSSTDLKTHQRKLHNSIECPYCHLQVVKLDFKEHLISGHQLTEEEAMHEILQSRDQHVNGKESPNNSEIEIDESDCDSSKILKRIKKELINETEAEAQRVAAAQDSLDLDKSHKRNEKKGDQISKCQKSVTKRRRNSGLTEHNSVASKKVENNLINETSKPAVRRSARRSHSTYQCTICKENFDNGTMLQNHLATNPKEAVDCPDCKSSFHSQTDYIKHNTSCSTSSCKQSCK